MGSDLYAIRVENKQQSICRLHISWGVCVRVSWTSNALNAVVITAPATGKHRRKWRTYGEIFSSVFFGLAFVFVVYIFFGFLWIWKRTFSWVMMAGRLRFRCAYARCVSANRASIYAKCQLVCSSLASARSSFLLLFLAIWERKKQPPNMRIANILRTKWEGKKWKSNKIKLASVLIKNDRKIIMKRAWKRCASGGTSTVIQASTDMNFYLLSV